MVIERRRRLRAVGAPPHFPKLDLNNPAQRSTVAFVLSFVVIFALISAVGSYKAYEFTDSVDFCGQLCHTVMHPEFTAYQASPHARVACVDCHVGSGASWYVKSKLSGMRQVYYTALGTYPRPIPTPVQNLRPAQQTCEQCHWPKKFWGAQLKTFTHYGSDEQNTPRVIRMLIKTGGGDPSLGQAGEGIHWHMNIANKVTYFATDEQRQVIPWVRIEDKSGNVTEYMVKDSPPTQAQIDKADKRRMDCIDCHNRPTHIYVPPDLSVDRAMTGRSIDATLPFIKQQGVEVLTADYKTADEALKAIAEKIPKFYQEKYPQIASGQGGQHQGRGGRTAAHLQHHVLSLHEGELEDPSQQHRPLLLSRAASAATMAITSARTARSSARTATPAIPCSTRKKAARSSPRCQAQPFKHPVDIGDLSAVNCSDCHSGGVGP